MSTATQLKARRAAQAGWSDSSGYEVGSGQARSARMSVFEFLERVLPAGGYYCLFHKGSGFPKHQWFDSITDMAKACTDQHANTEDLYFGTASYIEPTERKQTNVLKLKALRIDIDAGEAKHQKDPDGTYATQRDAVIALNQAFQAGLPKATFVLSSGEGVHAYWELTDEVTPEQWLPAAAKLQALCAQVGLKVDTKVTQDTARVLRPLHSLHHNGKRVGEALFKDFANARSLSAVVSEIEDQLSEETLFDLAAASSKMRSVNDDILEIKGPPASLAKVAEHCQTIAWMRDTRGQVPEPVWRNVGGVAKYCEDGEALFHEWSQGDPRYDYAETQRKFERWETPPATCDSFVPYGKCTGCKYKGQITTPKQLGVLTHAESVAAPDEGGKETSKAILTPVSAAVLRSLMPDRKTGADGLPIGDPLNTTDNLAALCRHHGITVRFNLNMRRTEISVPGLVAASDDYDNAAITHIGDQAVRIGMKRDGLAQLLQAIAAKNAYHPVVDALICNPWDGQDRRGIFYASLTLRDPKDAPLAKKLLDAFMLQLIAAIHSSTGFASQGMLVLCGGQGIGKSRWVASLVPVPGAVRTGLTLNPSDKDSVMRATSCAVAELGELDSTFRRSDIAALKAFITSDQDVLRRPYAVAESVFPRRTVFVGTVNGSGFLHDDTGNRRFWVINVTRCEPIPSGDMVQILAQYKAMYDGGASPYLDAETQVQLNESNKEHEAVDPLRERILTAMDWDVLQQPSWLSLPGAQWMTATDICQLRLGISEPSRSQCTKVGTIVRELNGGLVKRAHGLRMLAVPPRRATGRAQP